MNRGTEHMGFQMHRPPHQRGGGFAPNQGPPGGYNQNQRGGWNARNRGGNHPRDAGRGRARGGGGGGGRGNNYHSNAMHNGGRDNSHWSGDRGSSSHRGGPRRGNYDRRGGGRYDNRRRGDSHFRERHPRTRYGQHRGPSQFQRRQTQQQLKKNQNKLYRNNVFEPPTQVTYDKDVLPKWAGKGRIDSYFGAVDDPENPQKLSTLYDED